MLHRDDEDAIVDQIEESAANRLMLVLVHEHGLMGQAVESEAGATSVRARMNSWESTMISEMT